MKIPFCQWSMYTATIMFTVMPKAATRVSRPLMEPRPAYALRMMRQERKERRDAELFGEESHGPGKSITAVHRRQLLHAMK